MFMIQFDMNKKEKTIKYETPKGMAIFIAVRNMLGKANSLEKRVKTKFNGRNIVVFPGEELNQVLDRLDSEEEKKEHGTFRLDL